ncbi:MAG: FadR family transcriptional regulator [Oscillospiraceae bacterium]|nr:FadR family transcriptional regulator [Oscillospiraceae bacterium]
MEFEKIASVSLTDNIYKSLLGKILSGEWKPGDWFPAERDVAEQMGVSRSSLHHAVLQLERDGFVSVLPRKGTQVADYRKKPTPQSLSVIMTYGSEELDEPLFHDLMDIRRLVEIECTRRACSNIYASTMEEMRAIADRLAEENAAVPELIYRYHYMLTQASGNSIFAMMFRAFEPVLMVLIARHYSLRAVDLREAAAMHGELLDHIAAKDEDAAAECVERILAQGVNVLERKYKPAE